MLFGVRDADTLLVLGILVVFSLVEIFAGHFRYTTRNKNDYLVEFGGFVVIALVKPFAFWVITTLGNLWFPEANVFGAMGFWWALLIFILVDDFAQYWYHRSAHEYEWFWKAHRPHHAAEEMGLLVSYRNSALYYLFIPNLWWLAVFTVLGGGFAAAVGVVLKQLIIISSHSTTKWDQYLYKHKFLHPLAWIIERIIITPAVHHAHHGRSKADGVSDPNGNFGNMLFIWDQMFGTAILTRQYPKEYGLQTDPKDDWAAHLFYPFIKSKKEGSEISSGYQKVKTTSLEPKKVELEPGKYLWCQCGYSRNQPFCDGSHHGTKHKPVLFEVKRKTKASLCTCKHTKTGPFCDNSHLEIK